MKLKFNTQILEKYDIFGPRYTSYPTVPNFHSEITMMDWQKAIDNSNKSQNNLSLYFHIPFCHSLCYFCGCTMRITRNQELVEKYLTHLEKEMEIVSEKLDKGRMVSQIHFGGGTPNYLSSLQLQRLNASIHSHFLISENVEYSCEIDPRKITIDHISTLQDIGVNRISMGIQDFNSDVQQAINRVNSYAHVKKIVEWIQNANIHSINFDLIYGLPKQNLDTFNCTLNQILSLNPSRIACYNFAYVPWIKPHQKLMEEQDLPSPKTKIEMLHMIIAKLSQNGYEYIGMDHFAKSDDELTKAQKNGTLQRNFQGYSTQKSSDLFAFGISSISHFGNAYFQNSKDLNEYFKLLQNNLLPIQKGLIMSIEDIQVNTIIMRLMCDMKLDYAEISNMINIDFNKVYEKELGKIREVFEKDGLVAFNSTGLKVTDTGRFLSRNIAMFFDKYLSRNNSIYSKTI